MKLEIYHILHVFSLLVLAVHTYMALANPVPENRKRTLMITGIATLLVLVTGAGMVSVMAFSWASGWLIVKLLCWLGFSALAGLAYRKAHLRGTLSVVGLSLLLIALVVVYTKRF